MLTEQEAVEKARIAICTKGIVVTGLEQVRKVSVEHLPPHMKDLGDVWSVSFALPKVEGRVIGGNCVRIRVFDRTGEAEIVLSM